MLRSSWKNRAEGIGAESWRKMNDQMKETGRWFFGLSPGRLSLRQTVSEKPQLHL